jgi:transposase-like protein
MKRDIKTKSRRRTPWTEDKDPTPLQSFIDRCTERDYAHRHPTFEEMDEGESINSYELKTCRMCGSDKIVKDGKSSCGIARFKCNACGKRFTTIFDSHKIPISEWIGFLLDMFGYGSFGLTSKVNRNSNNTTMYWMDKTFCKVRSDDIERHDDGTGYREPALHRRRL